VIQVSPRLALAVTLHAQSSVQVSGHNHIKVANTQSGDQVFKFVHGYDPLSLGAAVAWQLGESVALVGTALWRQWSSYEDRHGEAPLDAWNDTVSLAAGLRWLRPGRVVRVDATFVPSPVPDQIGRTNYVDNTRLGGSAGIEWRRDLGGARLRGGLFVEAQVLIDRSVSKQANAPHPVIDEFPD